MEVITETPTLIAHSLTTVDVAYCDAIVYPYILYIHGNRTDVFLQRFPVLYALVSQKFLASPLNSNPVHMLMCRDN
jgi:hypothetical protein